MFFSDVIFLMLFFCGYRACIVLLPLLLFVALLFMAFPGVRLRGGLS